jgi:hypothetical protein
MVRRELVVFAALLVETKPPLLALLEGRYLFVDLGCVGRRRSRVT